MFKRQTLFIIGAGASNEIGLPVGTTLAATIADKLNLNISFEGERSPTGDSDIWYNIINTHRAEANEYYAACAKIRSGVQWGRSIDDFLYDHQDVRHVNRFGQCSIVKSILEAERASPLYTSQLAKRALDLNALRNSYFMTLFTLLSKSVSRANVSDVFANVRFIVFNYDRCLEQFFLVALQEFYRISEQEALQLILGLQIIHPYGAVGRFSRIAFGGGDEHRLSQDYVRLAESIRTYTEQITDPEFLMAIHAELHKAEQIIFLGFAYHEANMNLLRQDKILPS